MFSLKHDIIYLYSAVAQWSSLILYLIKLDRLSFQKRTVLGYIDNKG